MYPSPLHPVSSKVSVLHNHSTSKLGSEHSHINAERVHSKLQILPEFQVFPLTSSVRSRTRFSTPYCMQPSSLLSLQGDSFSVFPCFVSLVFVFWFLINWTVLKNTSQVFCRTSLNLVRCFGGEYCKVEGPLSPHQLVAMTLITWLKQFIKFVH